MNAHKPYQWTNQTLLEATNGIWHQLSDDFFSNRITTDSRNVQAGDVFLAICGENFDAHEFIENVRQAGVSAAIVERLMDCDLPQLLVADTKLALGDLGAYRRNRHPDLTVVALTGSAGKTSTKQMIGSIFSQIDKTLITRGNLNNDLGVPMMLLELTDEQKFAVLELGANHVGEIAYTANMVRPDVACVLNIGTAHLGEFGGVENIAAAKAEIFSALTESGVAVLPFFDDYYDFLREKSNQFSRRQISFGEKLVNIDEAKLGEADRCMLEQQGINQVLLMGDVFADDVEIYPTYSTFTLGINLQENELQTTQVRLPFVGEHNVINALAAAAIAAALGVNLNTIASGLEQAVAPQGRLTHLEFGRHTLIDDTYNANPTSVLAAAKVLQSIEKQKILVLGDIFELGDESIGEHKKLGEQLAGFDVDVVLALGEQMAYMVERFNQIRSDARHFDNKESLLKKLHTLLQQSDCVVLFKGSRGMAMESLIADLMKK